MCNDIHVSWLSLTLWPQAMLEELERNQEALTAKMYDDGNDAATVSKIVKDKEAGDAKVAKLYKEVKGR